MFAPSHRRESCGSALHTPQASQVEDRSLVPLSLVTTLQTSLTKGFSDMMQLHREVLSAMAVRESNRDQQIGLLITQHVELVKTVSRLRSEQSHFRESLPHRPK